MLEISFIKWEYWHEDSKILARQLVFEKIERWCNTYQTTFTWNEVLESGPFQIGFVDEKYYTLFLITNAKPYLNWKLRVLKS